ncbi:MAG: hypothetical protein FJ254_03570 [Phycisphaerae bacterium]|nr:hypothetical protein [Phycisphaerae bacterium]
MMFISPWLAVAGTVAMALPILIHLFLRRRQKPIEWAAMELLRRAVQQNQRARRVERWVLLALRCLVLMLVGLAIARPATLTAISLDRPVVLAVVLDDSVASRTASAMSPGETAFDAARAACIESIRALPSGSSVHVFTTSGLIEHTNEPVQPERAIATLNTLAPTYEPSRVRHAVVRADDALRRTTMPGHIVLASSFSRGALDTEDQVLPTTKATLEIRDVGSDDTGTAAITSVMQRTLGPQSIDSVTVDVTVTRPGQDTARRSVPVTVTDTKTDRSAIVDAVFIEGSQRAVATVTLMVDPTVTKHGWIATIPSDRQPADDQRCTTISTRSSNSVLVLDRERLDVDEGSSAQWIERALEPVPGLGLSHQRLDPAEVRASSLKGASSIIICRPELLDQAGWAECRSVCESGALIVIVPPTDETFVDWQDPCSTLLGPGVTIRRAVVNHEPPQRLQAQQPVSPITQLIASELTELVAPVEISRSIVIEGPSTAFSPILVMGDNTPMMVLSTRGRGVIVAFATAPVPSWSTLATKPIFVPLVQETIRQGEVLLDAGNTVTIGLGRLPEGTTELRPIRGSTTTDPTLTVDPSGVIVGDDATPGIMEAVMAQGANTGASRRTTLVALNVDPSACDPQRNDAARLTAWLNQTMSVTPTTGTKIKTTQSSATASAWLLMVAALIVLVETLLGRMYSVPEPKAT